MVLFLIVLKKDVSFKGEYMKFVKLFFISLIFLKCFSLNSAEALAESISKQNDFNELISESPVCDCVSNDSFACDLKNTILQIEKSINESKNKIALANKQFLLWSLDLTFRKNCVESHFDYVGSENIEEVTLLLFSIRELLDSFTLHYTNEDLCQDCISNNNQVKAKFNELYNSLKKSFNDEKWYKSLDEKKED